MNRKSFMFMLMVILIFVLTSFKSEYKIFTEKYEKNYIKIVQHVDTSNALDVVTLIHSKSEEIGQLRILLFNIKDDVPENKVEEYKKYQHDYEVLLFLSDAYGRWNQLTPDEKEEVDDKILEVTIGRDFY